MMIIFLSGWNQMQRRRIFVEFNAFGQVGNGTDSTASPSRTAAAAISASSAQTTMEAIAAGTLDGWSLIVRIGFHHHDWCGGSGSHCCTCTNSPTTTTRRLGAKPQTKSIIVI
jgi:hypothetical protein